MDNDEDRASIQFGWSEDDLEKQRERWEIMRDLQKQQMELSYEYQNSMLASRDKDIQLMKDSMQLQAGQPAKWLENYAIETPLLEQQHQLEKDQAQFKIDTDKEQLAIQRQRYSEESDPACDTTPQSNCDKSQVAEAVFGAIQT